MAVLYLLATCAANLPTTPILEERLWLNYGCHMPCWNTQTLSLKCASEKPNNRGFLSWDVSMQNGGKRLTGNTKGFTRIGQQHLTRAATTRPAETVIENKNSNQPPSAGKFLSSLTCWRWRKPEKSCQERLLAAATRNRMTTQNWHPMPKHVVLPQQLNFAAGD